MSLRLPRPRSKVTALLSVALVAFAVAWLGGAREAAAYPQFQFSSGTNRCSQCHYSPSGGGLLTSWGRDESGDTISLGGDGAFLHGLVSLPSALGIGGDIRYAFIANDVGNPSGTETANFPMQADLYLRGSFTESLSLNVTVGARGIVRDVDNSPAGRFGTIAERFISREHYLMWRPSATGPYVRVGRFFAPYGLRLAEHVYYVRRYTGFNLYEETYNASGGIVSDDWEAHATLFAPVPSGMPDPLNAIGPREFGAAGYGELRLEKMSALAGQFRVGISPNEARYQLGGIGKLWVEKAKMLFLGEADLIRQQFSGSGGGQTSFVSYLGTNLFLTRGLMLGVAYERFQEALAVKGTGRNAYDFQLNFYPWAHFELMLLGRYQITGSGSLDGASASLLMLQLHYYL
jgi:hypothetical protein